MLSTVRIIYYNIYIYDTYTYTITAASTTNRVQPINPGSRIYIHTILPVRALFILLLVIITFISIILRRLIERYIYIYTRTQATEGVKGHHRCMHMIYNIGIRFASEAVRVHKKKDNAACR